MRKPSRSSLGLLLIAALVGLVVAGASSGSASGTHVALKIYGHTAEARPKAIYPSPTAGPYAKQLNNWHGWGRNGAYAEGITYYDTCLPNCAVGYGRTEGRAILAGIHGCHGRLRYSKLRFAYYGAAEHNLRVSFNCKGEAMHVHIGP